jgi:hypothetical protein
VGIVGSSMASPFYFNVYWDTTWDADNPAVPMEAFDSYVKAATASSYFAGLSEYGVGMPGFGGSFVPAPQCTAKPGATVGFYDPVNPSIIGFLQCELDNAIVPQGDNVVYNIILPQGSTESDSLGNFLGLTSPQCTVAGTQPHGIFTGHLTRWAIRWAACWDLSSEPLSGTRFRARLSGSW